MFIWSVTVKVWKYDLDFSWLWFKFEKTPIQTDVFQMDLITPHPTWPTPTPNAELFNSDWILRVHSEVLLWFLRESRIWAVYRDLRFVERVMRFSSIANKGSLPTNQSTVTWLTTMNNVFKIHGELISGLSDDQCELFIINSWPDDSQPKTQVT